MLKVGTIAAIITSSTGKADVEGVGIVPYSIPLTDLIIVAAGQSVIGDYSGGTLYIRATLDSPWITTTQQINTANSTLPLHTFQSKVNNARCCAVKKAAKRIDDTEEGCCVEDEAVIEEMLNHIDVIECVIPEGNVIEGRQAVYVFAVEVLNPAVHFFSITIGADNYAFNTSNTNDVDQVATEIANFINSFYPQSYGWQAEAQFSNVLIWGENFDSDNGTAVSASITNGSLNMFTATQLDFGTASVISGANNLTNLQLQTILNKLCKLCKQ